MVANRGVPSFFADPHAFKFHFHLVNRVDLETILKEEVFVNEGDNQVRVTHKVLRYNPIQKSFSAPKHVIRAKDPWLHRITIAEHGFLLPEGSSAQGGVRLAGSSSSHQATEAEEVRAKSEKQVAELDQPEDEFGVFDQVDLPENPFVDLGDPSLIEVDL